MARIKIFCKTCNKDYQVYRTEEIPEDVTSLVCNWCPTCEDSAREEYLEEYRYLDAADEVKDPNQQSLF